MINLKSVIVRKKKLLGSVISVSISLLGLFAGLFLINKRTSFFNKAYESVTGMDANIVVDAGRQINASQNWGYLAQGGEEKGGMFDAVITDVRDLQPVYIRIDHIYDFYDVVGKGENGKLTFDFAQLDQEIFNIRSMGAKPFISISYMPQVLSTLTEVDIPVNWQEWQETVKATIEHISGTNGLAISDVYYEVWNEPDLFGGFKLNGDKNYLELYYYAAKGAQSARSVLPFKFGGPATTGLYKNWFDTLISYTQKNNLRMDFFSWHKYTYDINEYLTDSENAAKWNMEYPGFEKRTLAITESGPDSENSSVYDNKKSAIQLLALHVAAFGKVPIVFDFEIKDGPGASQYWGRWGILTNEKFGTPAKKPRYFALDLINKMVGTPVATDGQGSWVKAFSYFSLTENTLRILVVNYDRFDSHEETFPITVNNLPFKSFIVRRIDFLGSTKVREVTIDGTSWQTSEFFSPNSAAIFEIVGK